MFLGSIQCLCRSHRSIEDSHLLPSGDQSVQHQCPSVMLLVWKVLSFRRERKKTFPDSPRVKGVLSSLRANSVIMPSLITFSWMCYSLFISYFLKTAVDGFLNPAAQPGVFIPIFVLCPSSEKHKDSVSLAGLPRFILTMPEKEARGRWEYRKTENGSGNRRGTVAALMSEVLSVENCHFGSLF